MCWIYYRKPQDGKPGEFAARIMAEDQPFIALQRATSFSYTENMTHEQRQAKKLRRQFGDFMGNRRAKDKLIKKIEAEPWYEYGTIPFFNHQEVATKMYHGQIVNLPERETIKQNNAIDWSAFYASLLEIEVASVGSELAD